MFQRVTRCGARERAAGPDWGSWEGRGEPEQLTASLKGSNPYLPACHLVLPSQIAVNGPQLQLCAQA